MGHWWVIDGRLIEHGGELMGTWWEVDGTLVGY